MLPVLIFRHIAYEGPGYLEDYLIRKGIPYKMVCIDAGEPVPEDIEPVAGLVFMGGNMSVNDTLPWIAQEVALIRKSLAENIPVLGHCLGGQLIAKAMGATVTTNRVQEIGWHPATKIDNPASRIWLDGLEDTLELFHWHSETFSLPEGAVPLLESNWCENQGFAAGNTLALQCHVEMTENMIREWVDMNRDKLHASESVQPAEEMVRDLSGRLARLHRVADRLYDCWTAGLK
jgi:GMP synthase-like glutamine amidotransferase